MFDNKVLMESVIGGDEPTTVEQVNAGVAEGVPAVDILNSGLIAAMDIVGEKMENDDIFLPEVLMAARAMSSGVEILKPLLAADDQKGGGSVIIGTVKGDLHDIGKNLVAMMLESSGLDVYNLGVDVSPEDFMQHVKDKNAKIICLSALLTTTMPMMKATIDLIAENGLRDQVKVLIGGASVTQAYADEIGADGYAPDAGSAAKLAKSFLLAG
ncbi:MAG: corrinoid protein [Deltaproteobacteria bacterium]|jgi:5-methyltetrahydrofolate--homocysteine methyltransferase|nr:corrinoid protein [Deltaproteobacteria bacterium]MBT4269073.1 corrinoid protein [Deltaproteobacteria bacterium]MBT4638115.1 corrinoid protein [Deltaproteobacteria bacterium]MBT6500025.1 corrinoid protein [Deltaproteobacteria bacterium]MBT6612552.1 corrinoid protein [Deltaproteobacteria bacterium]